MLGMLLLPGNETNVLSCTVDEHMRGLVAVMLTSGVIPSG